MCGIAGYIGKKNIDDNLIKKCLNSMRRRGPDSSNFVKKNNSNINIALLHTRLKIIDINQRSDQPFFL